MKQFEAPEMVIEVFEIEDVTMSRDNESEIG